ncbi:MAG: hypothetical protein AB1730_04800 [Myxococcota bacterium]
MFEELREEEKEHQQWVRLEPERAPIALGAGFDDSDEPVAR